MSSRPTPYEEHSNSLGRVPMARSWFGGSGFLFGARLDIEVRGEVIFLRGELEGSTKLLLEEEVDRLINEGQRLLIFDLAELRFISASGMEMLTECHRRLASRGGWLELRQPTGTVGQVLDVCGLARFVRITA